MSPARARSFAGRRGGTSGRRTAAAGSSAVPCPHPSRRPGRPPIDAGSAVRGRIVGRTGLSGRPARRGRGDLLPWLASEVSRPNLDRSRSVLRRPLSVLLPAALSEWVAATRLPSPYGRGIRGQGSGGWGLGSGGWGLGAGTRVQGSGVSISRSQIPNLPLSNHKISKSPDLQISKSGRPSP
jgi:hypothetical protein